jgi:hypothetical protein
MVLRECVTEFVGLDRIKVLLKWQHARIPCSHDGMTGLKGKRKKIVPDSSDQNALSILG